MKYFSHKICRRYGIKLCQSDKCPVARRNYPAGQHGPKGRKRTTQYGLQMAEKQKAKAVYNLRERQFRNYYEKAIRTKGNTGDIMLEFLESRLDNVVFRAGFAKTRPQARQLVNHSHFLVNGKPVNIPSYLVRVKDEITIKPHKSGNNFFTKLDEIKKGDVPSWLIVDAAEKKIKVTAKPDIAGVEKTFNPRMIVESYSK